MQAREVLRMRLKTDPCHNTIRPVVCLIGQLSSKTVPFKRKDRSNKEETGEKSLLIETFSFVRKSEIQGLILYKYHCKYYLE